MERPCIIEIPTETGIETFNGFACDVVERRHPMAMNHGIGMFYYNGNRVTIDPLRIKFDTNKSNGNCIHEWIRSTRRSISSDSNHAFPYKKTIVIRFKEIEYKLFGCFPVEWFASKNTLKRFVILEKQNHFSKSQPPQEITVNIDSYSIGM